MGNARPGTSQHVRSPGMVYRFAHAQTLRHVHRIDTRRSVLCNGLPSNGRTAHVTVYSAVQVQFIAISGYSSKISFTTQL